MAEENVKEQLKEIEKQKEKHDGKDEQGIPQTFLIAFIIISVVLYIGATGCAQDKLVALKVCEPYIKPWFGWAVFIGMLVYMYYLQKKKSEIIYYTIPQQVERLKKHIRWMQDDPFNTFPKEGKIFIEPMFDAQEIRGKYDDDWFNVVVVDYRTGDRWQYTFKIDPLIVGRDIIGNQREYGEFKNQPGGQSTKLIVGSQFRTSPSELGRENRWL